MSLDKIHIVFVEVGINSRPAHSQEVSRVQDSNFFIIELKLQFCRALGQPILYWWKLSPQPFSRFLLVDVVSLALKDDTRLSSHKVGWKHPNLGVFFLQVPKIA